MSKITVLYITSLPHSGSTLLDQLLNAHSEIISVGEIKQLPLRWTTELQGEETSRLCCSCGKILHRCHFWSQVTGQVERLSGKPVSDLDLKGRQEKPFVHDNENLFKIISEVSERRFVVDSSKDVTRLRLLKKVPSIEVFPVVLTRDPKGQICSVRAKSVRKGWPRTEKDSIARLITRYNKTSGAIQDLVQSQPHVMITYEQLVAHPQQTLMSILMPLGLAFEPQQLRWASQPRHLVAGNHMRWQTDSEIKNDQRWKRQLTALERISIDVSTFSARYPAFRNFENGLVGIGTSLLSLSGMLAKRSKGAPPDLQGATQTDKAEDQNAPKR